MITGLTRPAAGTVTFDGHDLVGRKEHQIVRLGVGRTFQTSVVFEELSVVENLDLAACFRRPLWSLARRRKGVSQAVEEALARTGLEELADRPAGVLSHGQRQWLEIGMLLAQRPRLLLLDEPVAGMSREERERTGELLTQIADDHTVIVVEHDMEFLRRHASKVTVLHEGKVLVEGRWSRSAPIRGCRRSIWGGSPAMLSVSDLESGYGRARVLFGVSLDVEPGQLVCVMGRNGVGKTTLLNTVMGVLPATAGAVTFDGRDVTKLKPHERVRLGMGYVPQGHQCFPQLSVLGNLLVTAEAAKAPKGAIDEALEIFPRLKPLLKRRAGHLSGGQQQQLAIARVLVTGPRMLILDEPTEGIQPSIIQEIEEAIERLHASGLAVLLVEQYLDIALRLADRFVILDGGHVVRTGAAEELNGADVHRLLAV